MLGYNVSVPPHVRQALLSRSVDNDDLLRNSQARLLTHGARDAVVKPDHRRPAQGSAWLTRRFTSWQRQACAILG